MEAWIFTTVALSLSLEKKGNIPDRTIVPNCARWTNFNEIRLYGHKTVIRPWSDHLRWAEMNVRWSLRWIIRKYLQRIYVGSLINFIRALLIANNSAEQSLWYFKDIFRLSTFSYILLIELATDILITDFPSWMKTFLCILWK